MEITKDMLIGDIINKYPEAAGIMLGYGLHCVGCSANPFDTVEGGCMSHGMDEETVGNLVGDLNKMVGNLDNRKGKVVSITKVAAQKFLEFMKEEKKSNIKLGVIDNGHGTLQYSLDFSDSVNKTEEIFEDNGIKILVEKDVVDMVRGLEIDYVKNKNGSGFKIKNPNSKAGGCGSGCGCAE